MRHAPWRVWPIAALLGGCASNPEQSIYVMSTPASAQAGPPAASDSLVLELRPVALPDYLDTTDLVLRTGRYSTEASRTGRWGERLSKGVTRALATDLAHCLHAGIVTGGPPETAVMRISVAISAFDVTTTTSVLAASWTIVWQGDFRPPVTRHDTFSTIIADPGDEKIAGDAAIVAGMADTVAKLSDGIAVTVHAEKIPGGPGRCHS